MVCYTTTISATGTLDITVTYGVKDDGTTDGTMILHGGGGGTRTFDNGFVNKFTGQGKRVVQVMWPRRWMDTNVPTKNIKTAAARPATLIQHVFDHVHNSNTAETFGFFGSSGGSAALAYSLAHYGMGDKLDCAMMSSGPVFGNIAKGCHPGAQEKWVCPHNQFGCSQAGVDSFKQAPQVRELAPQIITGTFFCAQYYDGACTHHSLLGDCNCNNPPTSDEIVFWSSQSVVSNGANYTYPTTALMSAFCTPETNNSPPQGQFYADELKAGNMPEYTMMLIDNCSGTEGTWNGDWPVTGENGLDAMANWASNHCVIHP